MDTAVFAVGLLAEAVVLCLLLFRRVYKSLPIFTSYFAWSILNDIGVFILIRRFPKSDLRIYIVSAIIDAAFMFCILTEISLSVLKPIRSSLTWWTGLAIGGLAACLCGVVWLFAKPSGYNATPQSELLVHLQLTTAIVRVLFFMALAASSQLLSLSWRDRELQAATGFGIYSFVSLMVELVHLNPAQWSSSIMPQSHVLDEIASVSYVLSVLYWAYSFAQKVPERREFTPQMQNFLLAVAGNARATRMAMTGGSKSESDRNRRS